LTPKFVLKRGSLDLGTAIFSCSVPVRHGIDILVLVAFNLLRSSNIPV
jgi:hypothetical protein